jgi:hypothetical protein
MRKLNEQGFRQSCLECDKKDLVEQRCVICKDYVCHYCQQCGKVYGWEDVTVIDKDVDWATCEDCEDSDFWAYWFADSVPPCSNTGVTSQ